MIVDPKVVFAAVHSLKVVNNVGKWAFGPTFLLCEAENSAIFWRVLLPLWLERQVVVHSLVTEEEVLVTKVRSCQLRGELDLANQFLRATHLLGLIHGVDFVEDRALSDGHQVIKEVRVALCDSAWELVVTSGSKSEFPGEFD